MRKQQIILALCVLTLVASVPGRTVFSQSSAWQQPTQLSEAGRFSWFPDIVADASGRVHVAWSSGDNRYDVVMYTTKPGASGGPVSWSRPVDVAALRVANVGASAATRPGMVVDKLGYLQLTYTDYNEIFYAKAFQDWATSPQAWTDPRTVNTETSTYFSRMALDSQGRLHLVYTQNVYSEDCPICFQVYYRSSADNGNTWSAPVDISLDRAGSGKPQILVDRNDNIHIVWELGSSGGTLGTVNDPTKAMYSASYDGGKTWTMPYEFTTGVLGAQSKIPSIAEDGEGSLVVTWRGVPEEVVYTQVSHDSGRSWSAPQRILGAFTTAPVYGGGLDAYSMATDGAGSVHLVMAGRMDQDQQALSVLHLVWNGASWSEPVPIVTYANGDVPEWPRIAVGLGNQLHATWFTRDQANVFGSDSATANYRVWYSAGISDAPAVPPAAYPTPAPPAPQTSVAEVKPAQPAPEAIATFVPQVSNMDLKTELDDVSLLLFSILPVVGLILVVLLLFRRRNG